MLGPGQGLALLVLALFVGLTAGGCKSLTGPAGSNLHDVVKRFHHDLRWKYSENASGRVNPLHAADFRERLEEVSEDLDLTSWTIRKVEVNSETGRARLKVRLHYVLLPSTVVKKETVEQVWHLVEDQWFLFSMTGGPLPFPAEDETAEEGEKAPEEDSPKPEPKATDPAPGIHDLPDSDPDG